MMKTTILVVDPEVEYPKVKDTIFKLAWKFAQQHPYPSEEQAFEEYRSIGYWAFMNACRDFKPDRKMKFNSWVYQWCWDLMKNHVMAASKAPTFLEVNEEILGEAPSLRVESLELIEDLSEDARTMVALIIETPKDLLGDGPLSIRQLMKKVKEHMVRNGTPASVVNKAHLELKSRFAEAWAA